MVVVGVGRHCANVKSLRVEVDGCNQPEMVACNVEHKIITDLVDCVECLLQFGEIAEPALLDDAPPALQRPVRGGVLPGEVAQGFVAEQAHCRRLSHFAIFGDG